MTEETDAADTKIQNFIDKYFEAAAFVFPIVCTVDETDFSSDKCIS